VDRIRYFHDAVQTVENPLSDAELAELVNKYVESHIPTSRRGLTHPRCINRDEEELTQLQQERRKGRPPVRREEALMQRTQTEEKEFKTGFWMPDMSDADVLVALKHWNGQWSGLSPMKFIRLTQAGVKQSSSFPPKSIS
jgi:translation machinery-associated protein 16